MSVTYALLCVPVISVAALSVWLNIPAVLLGAALGACLLVGNTSNVENPALKKRIELLRAQRSSDSNGRSSREGAAGLEW